MNNLIFPVLLLNIVAAHSKQDSLPGNLSLPSSEKELLELANYEKDSFKYSVEDYFTTPRQSEFQLSPKGNFISYRERDEKGNNQIYVKDIKNGKIYLSVNENEDPIIQYLWAGDEKLLFIKDKGGDENYHLFSASIDGKNIRDLTPFDGVTLSTIHMIKEQPDKIIVPLNKNNSEIFEPFKININTGEIELIYKNRNKKQPVDDFIFDQHGNLRAIVKQIDGIHYQLLYRSSNKEKFEEVVTCDWKDHFEILQFHPYNLNQAYVKTNIGRDKIAVILYDLRSKKVDSILFEHPDFDASNIKFSKMRGYEIDYYQYIGEKEMIVPVSVTFKTLHQKFEEQFNNYQYKIISRTDNEQKYLLLVSSDRLYGAYYLYDVQKNTFEKLINLMPQLKEEDMAEMKPITFKSRDGITINGYLTLPREASERKQVPLIVNPHGGPYGERDIWEFNPEAQLFASRGYGTLQINYRGSGGYGKAFYLAGSKEIGRKMLNDLEDGVKYVIEQGWVNREKVGIYGASYGGLAALGSLIKNPELYKCGVDYVGVSNLFTFINSFPSYWKPYMQEFYAQWYDPDIPEEKKIMELVSPALNVNKLNKPVFVIQGANDPRVNINESDQIVEKLRKKGYDVPYMVKYNEGHGFYHEENRIILYKCMMGFFSKHLKSTSSDIINH